MPAPVIQRLKLGRQVLGIEVFKAHPVRPRPVDPIIGMVELDPDIANQPAAGHVFARVTAVAGLAQVMPHIQRKLLDHRPAAHKKHAHGPGTQGVVTHALVDLVLDCTPLAFATVPNQLLGPLGVTGFLHKRPCSVEDFTHNPNPF